MKWIAMVALVLGACVQESGGSRTMTGGNGGGGVGGGGAGGGDGGTGGIGGDAGAGGTGGMPTDIPSIQTVTFDLHNGSVADRYVVISGYYCDDYAISNVGMAIPRNIGFQCLCECPNPGSPYATRFHHVSPGASYQVTWDARVLLTYYDPYDCAAHGWPGLPPTMELFGVHQPVPASTYTVTFGIERGLPPNCTPTGTDDWDCTNGFGGDSGGTTGGGGGPPPLIQQICASSAAQSFNFTLPPMGNLTVPIALQ